MLAKRFIYFVLLHLHFLIPLRYLHLSKKPAGTIAEYYICISVIYQLAASYRIKEFPWWIRMHYNISRVHGKLRVYENTYARSVHGCNDTTSCKHKYYQIRLSAIDKRITDNIGGKYWRYNTLLSLSYSSTRSFHPCHQGRIFSRHWSLSPPMFLSIYNCSIL